MTLKPFITLHALFSFILAIGLYSCGGDTERPEDVIKITTQESMVPPNEAALELNNPAIFLGSDFGSFLRSLYGIGDFERMLAFTANEVRSKYGDTQLLASYRELDLRMEMRLLSITQTDSLLFMNYECIDKATKTVRRLPIIIENDSVKVFPLRLEDGTMFEE
jgi:hypothetical protein